jgi:hypothetical protein
MTSGAEAVEPASQADIGYSMRVENALAKVLNLYLSKAENPWPRD